MAYNNDYKMSVVTEHRQGTPIRILATKYGMCERTIYRWLKEFPEIDYGSVLSIKEHRSLQRRIKKLENIISVLKAVNCTANSPLKEKLRELKKLYGQYDIHTLCEALDVSRGTFYNHILRSKGNDAWFMKRREEYRILIQKVFDEFNQILGPAKIQAVLSQRGHKVSERFVTTLMDEMGLHSVRSTSKRDYKTLSESVKKENILNQQFQADAPNKVWTSDITHFKVKDRHFYICVILDLFSRRIVSYRISRKNSTQLVSSTFRQAVSERGIAPGLIFHSDRGTQYTSHSFCKLLATYSIVQSFSATGRPHDNAVTESFFATLKQEELYRKDYPSEKKFKQAVDSYMTFYNTKRPHKKLKNLTPCKVEEKFYACQSDMEH